MYNDAHLPDDEAWTNLTAELRETKESRNAIRKENSRVFCFSFHFSSINFSYRQMKRRLAEVESEKEECVLILLRNTGPIPTTSILDGVPCFGHTDLFLSSVGNVLFICYHLLVY